MTINITSHVLGRFKLEAFKCDENGDELPGSRKVLAPWFSNLITDNGLNLLGSTDDFKAYHQVGSGSATPSVSDVSLSAWVAGSNTTISASLTAQSSAPRYGSSIRGVRFGAGVAAGNISEVGVSPGANGNLFSRALVLDSLGNPTTVTVLADEFLDVIYEFRQYAPLIDGAGTVELGGVVYDYVSRAARASSSEEWAQSATGRVMGFSGATAYNGAIGAITGIPAGTSSALGCAPLAYSSGSMQTKCTVTASPAQGNLSGGIKSLYLTRLGPGNANSTGAYQVEFTPAIPKTATNSLSLILSVTWARKTL